MRAPTILLALALTGCHAPSPPPPPTVTVPDVERVATAAAPPPRDPRPAACIEASPCIVVRVGDDGWEVNGADVETGKLRETLSELATPPEDDPDARFHGIVWIDLPPSTPFPKWMNALSAVADSRAIDVVVSEGPRAVPVGGMSYVSQPALMVMAERDVAYVMFAPDGTPASKAPITTRTATPDDIAEVAARLCAAPAPCWTLVALEPDGMRFGALATWLTALQPLLYKGRAVRITFGTAWAERLKRH